MAIYAGIGSRETPPHILTEMTTLATRLAQNGWSLRSGGAAGADTAFQRGAGLHTIYTPRSPLNWPSLMLHASQFHPNWSACQRKGEFVCRLHARNSAIILGPTLDTPVNLIICWTPGGLISGGTGQALRIAAAAHIPVINLFSHAIHDIWADRVLPAARQTTLNL